MVAGVFGLRPLAARENPKKKAAPGRARRRRAVSTLPE